jgi:hypothetical protein
MRTLTRSLMWSGTIVLLAFGLGTAVGQQMTSFPPAMAPARRRRPCS